MPDPTDRLRANLHAAGLPVNAADLAGIAARGFLSRLAAFEHLLATVDPEQMPDYLDFGSLPVPSVTPNSTSLPLSALPGAIHTVAAQIRTGATSPVALTEQALARIATLDPRLNAFQLVMAEQARAAAQCATTELGAGQDRGPLHGVPVAVKDLFAVAGQPHTAGSKLHADRIATTDATAVARLRAAGAIIVGTTRMSEFAYSPGSNNAHYGPTANPFDQARDTGGSSSGSAAAVAAGMVYAALGSDTGCSIRIPAAFCGLVGLKPTWGRVSLAGAMPLAWSLDHAGPLTRSVGDAALMLAILAGPDQRDGRTLQPVPPFTADALTAGVTGLRVGLLRDDGSGLPLASPEQLGAVQRAAAALAAAGASVVEVDLPQLDTLRIIGSAILAMEAAALHLPWLRTHFTIYGEFMRQRVVAALAYEAGAFVRAQQVRATLRQSASTLFAQVDVLLGPIFAGPLPALGVPAANANAFALPFNCLGWPALTQPAGLGSDGLPLAVQLVAAPWQEASLLRAAYVVEQALGLLTPEL